MFDKKKVGNNRFNSVEAHITEADVLIPSANHI